ncbi:MAG: hypothetical protein ACXABY_09240 [Candidatus Thorarchaeota archaeon]
MAKPGEWYQIELSGIDQDSEITIILSFNHSRSVTNRLEVKDQYQAVNDLLTRSVYHIRNESVTLCLVNYVGLDSVMFGEERARLEIASSDYHVYLMGIQIEEGSSEIEIPPSFQIILALCSLVPFFLLMPDAINDLQSHLDADAASKGVYGRILALLLPILSIALTLLLLGGLDVFQ